jgi:uncharacterized protein
VTITEPNTEPAQLAGVIDADVHPVTKLGWPDLRTYVSQDWARRLGNYANMLKNDRGPAIPLRSLPGASAPADAGQPRSGSDPDRVREVLFDHGGLESAILVPLESLFLAELLVVDETLQLARAYNDYFAEHWLASDPRFGLAIVISPHHPREAVVEIERWAGHPGVVGVVMALTDMLMGRHHYRPIYEAAEAAGLPIITHTGHTPFEGTPTYGGGTPADYVQRHCLVGELAMSNIVSLVFEGTFNLFPSLKCVFSGSGFSWLPHVMWRMDQTWEQLPPSLRSVQEPPSAIVRRNIRLTTGIEEAPERPEAITSVWELCHGEDTLMYGSDYPHWTSGPPIAFAEQLSADRHRAALRERALETFPRLETQLRVAMPAAR